MYGMKWNMTLTTLANLRTKLISAFVSDPTDSNVDWEMFHEMGLVTPTSSPEVKFSL